ncbi:MAG: hypothetical protein ACLFM0_10835 [Spirochaetales bacterium]
MSSAAAAGAAGGAAGTQAASQVDNRSRLRKIEGEPMSVWMLTQDEDRIFLAIGIRVKRNKLQAQELGSGQWQTIGKFSDAESCSRVFKSAQKQLNEGSKGPIRVPQG